MNISVVVPVYNTEEYLAECLESLVKQKFAGLEIIVVDNGSTDDSLLIAKEFKRNYPDIIRILKCKKPGASAARNLGAKEATGNYLWFVDSDDWVAKDSLSKLFKRAKETGADAVVMTVIKKFEDGKETILGAVEPEKDTNWRDRYVMYGFGPFQNLYRRKFWLEKMGGFDEGMIHEDMALLSAAVLHTEKIVSVPEGLYFYRQREGSVLHQPKWNKKALDIFPAMELIYQRFEKSGKLEKYIEAIEYFFIWNLLLDAAREFGKWREGKVGFRQIRKTMRKFFPNWRKNRYFRRKSLGIRLRCYLGYSGLIRFFKR